MKFKPISIDGGKFGYDIYIFIVYNNVNNTYCLNYKINEQNFNVKYISLVWTIFYNFLSSIWCIFYPNFTFTLPFAVWPTTFPFCIYSFELLLFYFYTYLSFGLYIYGNINTS